MKQTASSDSPVLNRPWDLPTRRWALDDRFRTTDDILCGRRDSGADQPVPAPRKSADDSRSLVGADRSQCMPHRVVNELRVAVQSWREDGHKGLCADSKRLLEYWTHDRSGAEPPFFCQQEAVETVMFLHEARPNLNNEAADRCFASLSEEADAWSDGVLRTAVKMATGAGKTRVMGMLIAWWCARMGSRGAGVPNVLVVAPNLTIKRNLEKSLCNVEDGNVYQHILPPNFNIRPRVAVENYHQFQPHGERIDGESISKTMKGLLSGGGELPSSMRETAESMLDRKLGALRGGSPLLVLNDEAHHCYLTTGDRGGDAQSRQWEREAGVWFSLLQELRDSSVFELGLVVDLSATPMFLRRPANMDVGKGYTELFPWVVSDTPLIEAVECGLTKIPRVPVDDDASGEDVVYRNLYQAVDKKDRKLRPGHLPPKVDRLLVAMERQFRDEAQRRSKRPGAAHPVFILIVNSIENAEALYQHIAGSRREADGVETWTCGAFPDLSNVRSDQAGPKEHAPTLLVHSRMAEDGLADRAANLQKAFVPQGSMTGQKYKEHLQKMFDNAASSGTPGEHVRCIVSVSMLTEGWTCGR